MSLASGTRLGAYEIQSALGAGGMGEVYRARDTRLDRDVAIKVLPEAFANDPERLARFEREAKVLASLNHPHIAAIYGVEGRALVMELVEGQPPRGPLPLAEALAIARQIAEALDYAHERGIVHRDLKPANIVVTGDGVVKVLDFGLAKAFQGPEATGAANASQSPTLTMAATQAGVILGTAAYMAPEQARGKSVDKRADIWAFGVVLYELLTGERLFAGENTSDVLGDVLTKEPDWDKVPERARPLLRRCLQKDPKQRLRDIGEAMAWVEAAPATSAAIVASRPRVVVVMAALTVIAIAVALAGWLRPQPQATGAVTDLAVSIEPGADGLEPVGGIRSTPQISPDGSAVIFFSRSGTLLLRRLNSPSPETVRAAGIRNSGFWDVGSKTFLFSDGVSLKKMVVPDGAPEVVAQGVSTLLGGSVSDRGTILLSAVAARADLYTVSPDGTGIDPVDVPGLTSGSSRYPEFLPGSEDFLFLNMSESSEAGVYLATLRDGRATGVTLLMMNATAARYTPAGGGRILFVRDDNLYAQRLDRVARTLEGEPELIQRGIASSPAFRAPPVSVSRTGAVAWRSGKAGLSQVTIFDRTGTQIGTAGPPALVQTLRLAPDETRLLLGESYSSWLLEPNQPGLQRLEHGSFSMLWLPDGSGFLDVASKGQSSRKLVVYPVAGGPGRELASPAELGRPQDVSPDGKTYLFDRGAFDTGLFAASLDAPAEAPRSLVQSGEVVLNPGFSHDGRWIVYQAGLVDAQVSQGVFVQPFPGPGRRTQIAASGTYPRWRKDGREIVYLDAYRGQTFIWSVSIDTSGGVLRAEKPVPLFPVRLPAATFGDLNFLEVSRDGSRFYIPQAVEQPRLQRDAHPHRLGDAMNARGDGAIRN